MLVAPRIQIGPQLPADFQKPRVEDDDAEEGELDEDEADSESHLEVNYAEPPTDSRGYYHDGAYTALPGAIDGSDSFDYDEAEDGEPDDQTLGDAYFQSLMRQYLSLRAKLAANILPNAGHSLPASIPTRAEPATRNSRTASLWTKTILETDPHPLELALMTKDSVFVILNVLLSGKLLQRGYPLPERTSRWLWALLARLPERGELTHWELGWVRDLGKRAVLLGRSLAEMAALREEVAEGQLGVDEEPDHGGEAGDAILKDETADKADLDEHAVPTKHPLEDGNVTDDEAPDIPMDIESVSEEGEVDEHEENAAQDLEEARRRLLAKFDQPAEEDPDRIARAAKERAEMNMRATLNMILTVTGEFYGQRDLLEFREPFGSV